MEIFDIHDFKTLKHLTLSHQPLNIIELLTHYSRLGSKAKPLNIFASRGGSGEGSTNRCFLVADESRNRSDIGPAQFSLVPSI